MKAFLEKWASEAIEPDAEDYSSKTVEPKPEPELEFIHYALSGKAILGEPAINPCEVGCGAQANFYYQDGIEYGYCSRCGVHQRIHKVQ